MKVKFSRCNSNSLTEVPIVDGQLIYTKDTAEVYLDVGETRNKVSDIIITDVSKVTSPIENKIYIDLTSRDVYVSIKEDNKVVLKDILENVKTRLDNIEKEQATQNTNIKTNTNNISINAKNIDTNTKVIQTLEDKDTLVVSKWEEVEVEEDV